MRPRPTRCAPILPALSRRAAMTRATLADAPGFRRPSRRSLRRAPRHPPGPASARGRTHGRGGDPPSAGRSRRLAPPRRRGCCARSGPAICPPTAPRAAIAPSARCRSGPICAPPAYSAATAVETRATEGTPEEGEGRKTHRARRRKADQADRSDSFILHKFEAILSWAEFINLNRRVEDDENDDAKKAADDADEIGLGQISKAPATRLKLHLDLAARRRGPRGAVGRADLSRMGRADRRLSAAHVRVLTSTVEAGAEQPPFRDDPRAARRIRAVRRQFEALRPGRISTAGHR